MIGLKITAMLLEKKKTFASQNKFLGPLLTIYRSSRTNDQLQNDFLQKSDESIVVSEYESFCLEEGFNCSEEKI